MANVGDGDAENVLVQDPIPANTIYVNGTLLYEGAAKTDAADSDEGQFEAVNNRVAFVAGTLPGGESRTMTFTVQVQSAVDRAKSGGQPGDGGRQQCSRKTRPGNPRD